MISTMIAKCCGTSHDARWILVRAKGRMEEMDMSQGSRWREYRSSLASGSQGCASMSRYS
jgi:hypothetical protein